PAATDNTNDSESCSVQPQLGGACCIAAEIGRDGRCNPPVMTASGLERCDFTTTVCPISPGGLAQTCAAQRGAPKYGDYNGSACSGGRFYMVWASATAPGSIAASTSIDPFFSIALVSAPQCAGFPCGVNRTKVLICHIPPDNPFNPQTLCIGPDAVPGHLNHHGDHCGPCR